MTGRWFSPGTPVSSTNKTDHHEITEILLKVALNTINHTLIVIYVVLCAQDLVTIHVNILSMHKHVQGLVLCAFTISKTSFMGSSLISHASERQKDSTYKIIMIVVTVTKLRHFPVKRAITRIQKIKTTNINNMIKVM